MFFIIHVVRSIPTIEVWSWIGPLLVLERHCFQPYLLVGIGRNRYLTHSNSPPLQPPEPPPWQPQSTPRTTKAQPQIRRACILPCAKDPPLIEMVGSGQPLYDFLGLSRRDLGVGHDYGGGLRWLWNGVYGRLEAAEVKLGRKVYAVGEHFGFGWERGVWQGWERKKKKKKRRRDIISYFIYFN